MFSSSSSSSSVSNLRSTTNTDKEISKYDREGFYKILFSRRDVRSHFINKNIPLSTILRIINAAHHAPSVGYSQPWNFIMIKGEDTRKEIKESFLKEHAKAIKLLDNDKVKQTKYKSLKLEGILESNINICVTYDYTRFAPFIIGKTSIPETGIYSVCCAIQNLWLAARAEEIGMGWVSIISNKELKKILKIPKHIKPIAYLCLGYVSEFSIHPDLEKSKWLKRIDLDDIIYLEKWGKSFDRNKTNCMD
ncbi:MAG TPA: 5,6-dimethylbenzimidazole synthase [Nitrososphaeraceae archaeon]|nr:5,6-dimethylbenzimidazole synthase [Nitrososphaeraceae archaeon]